MKYAFVFSKKGQISSIITKIALFFGGQHAKKEGCIFIVFTKKRIFREKQLDTRVSAGSAGRGARAPYWWRVCLRDGARAGGRWPPLQGCVGGGGNGGGARSPRPLLVEGTFAGRGTGGRPMAAPTGVCLRDGVRAGGQWPPLRGCVGGG